jgi:hypothetical protein
MLKKKIKPGKRILNKIHAQLGHIYLFIFYKGHMTFNTPLVFKKENKRTSYTLCVACCCPTKKSTIIVID